MEKYIITRDGEQDLKFEGELIASASSSPESARGDYSGSVGRWTELRLYRTKGGKYVCQSIGRTQWQGEHDRCKGAVCADAAGVCAFFGASWLAKELFVAAEIDCAENVD